MMHKAKTRIEIFSFIEFRNSNCSSYYPMTKLTLKWALVALWGFGVSNPFALADQNWSSETPLNKSRPESCGTFLSKQKELRSDEDRLQGRLGHPDMTPPKAIREILHYLISHPDWDGSRKHKAWEEFVSFFNRNSKKHWIASPCAKAKEGHIACWGDIRGHLLVFEKSGALFKTFNPERADVKKDSEGFFIIDWDDPKLTLLN